MSSRRALLGKVIREVTQAFSVDELEVLSKEIAMFVEARRLAEEGLLTAESLDTDSLVNWS